MEMKEDGVHSSAEHDHEEDEHHGGHAEEEHEGGHDEPWLVSYADMMTLLFGFFVIMYSFASAKNQEQWAKIKKEFAQHFGGEYIQPTQGLADKLNKIILESPLRYEAEARIVGDNLLVEIQSKAIFELGSARLLPGQEAIVGTMIQAISEFKNKNYHVVAEGHTDDLPISTLQFRSNWDLSGARAATLISAFERYRYPKSLLSYRAYADTRPKFPNRDQHGKPIPINQARNRRVTIKLVPSETMENDVVSAIDRPDPPTATK